MVGRPPKYPWNDWFAAIAAGQTVAIIRGVDFTHAPEHMRVQLLQEARKREVRLKTVWLPRAGRFDVTLSRRRLPSRQQWENLLDGDPHRLIPGLDFDGSLQTMADTARQAGRRRGFLVRTTIRDGSLWLQAFNRERSAVVWTPAPQEVADARSPAEAQR